MTQAAHREGGRMVSVSSLMLGCCLFPTLLLGLPSDKVQQALYPNGLKQVTQEEGVEKNNSYRLCRVCRTQLSSCQQEKKRHDSESTHHKPG